MTAFGIVAWKAHLILGVAEKVAKGLLLRVDSGDQAGLVESALQFT
jgi:hypothetical protein